MIPAILAGGLAIAGCQPPPGAVAPVAPTSEFGRVDNRDEAIAQFQMAGVFLEVKGEGGERKLTQIDFRQTPVGDEGLQNLRLFPELTFVGLFGCREVTDAGMEHLRTLTNLEFLLLGGARITDKGLSVVAEMPKLKRLEFQSTAVTDAGLVHLKKLKSLGYIKAGGTQVGDAGMAHLAEIPTLQYLNLVSTQVGDDGLTHLALLPALGVLILDGCPVTDAGLAHLKATATLEALSVSGTRVSAEGAKALQEGRPKLRVTR
jgi:internalin A